MIKYDSLDKHKLSRSHRKFKPKTQSEFESVVIFGDSLSDFGNLSTLIYLGSSGQFWFPPSPPLLSPNPIPPDIFNPFGGSYYSKAPYYNSVKNWEKRHQPILSPSGIIIPFTPNDPPQVSASNGPIWVDFLPKALGLSPNQVSNYAYAGATTGFTNGLQPFLPSPLNTPLPLPGLLTEIKSFTDNTVKADPKALYVVWAGANDGFNLAGYLANNPPSSFQVAFSTIISTVETAVKNITFAITSLADKGAHTFLVPNLPDLGKTPLLSQNQQSAFIGKAFSILFDVALEFTLPKLERSLHIDIVKPDVYSLAEDVFKRPQEYGFKNVTEPLITQNPLNPDVKPEDFFWYDYQHPTTQGHALIAEFFQESLFASSHGMYGANGNLSQFLGSELAKDALELAGDLFQQGIGSSDFKSFINDLSGLLPPDKSFLSLCSSDLNLLANDRW